MEESLIYNAVCDGYDVGIYFHYFPGINHILTRYGGQFVGRKNSPWHRYWRFPLDRLDAGKSRELYDELTEAGAPHGAGEEWEIFRDMLQFTLENQDRAAFISEISGCIYPMQDGGAAITFSEYHSGVVGVCRSMRGRFFRAMKAWCFPDVTPAMLQNNLMTAFPFEGHQIEIMPGQYDVLEDGMLKPRPKDAVGLVMENCAQVSRGTKSAEDVDNGVLLAVTTPLQPTSFAGKDLGAILSRYSLYRPYQVDGVTHLLSRTSALLADDMGLGKTRQAVVAGEILLSYGNHAKMKGVVAAPASLVLNWKKEIEMVAPEAKVSAFKWDDEARWVVTSYDQLAGLVQYSDRIKVLFTDEAHQLKDPAAVRTRTVFDVAAKVPYRYILTGTPILNKEAEIHTLLRLAGHPLGQLAVKDFTQKFGGNQEFRRMLNERISEWMLRRTKEVVLNLPGKVRQLVYTTLPPEVMREYERIDNDCNLTALMKIGKLRMMLERAKIEHIIMDMVGELGGSDKVIVFCEFKSNVNFVADLLEQHGIEVVTLTGDDSPRKRQAAVDAFQEEDDIRGFVGTTLAAGVGITLTAANYVFFASLPWTSALKNQGEDRAYRNGQKRTVFIKIPLVDNTLDIDLWQMLCFKNGISTDIISAEGEDKAMEAFALQWESKKKKTSDQLRLQFNNPQRRAANVH
ncbi:MAG: DEAD/DEAH box helicase [Geobacter sp.]|nr:MAG: DEAD/DEAH box helicase [Geobacter sp.]